MELTVKEVAEIAGVSRRTLHYYDEIGLLKPTIIAKNRYRYYDKEGLLQLQQILFFREMDFSLKEIQSMLERPDFDQLHMMQNHRAALKKRVGRLNKLIKTLDKTILHLEGKEEIMTLDLFDGFDEETQAAYAEEAARRWDADLVRGSMRKWSNLSDKHKTAILEEASVIHQSLLENMTKGYDSEEIQVLVGRWYSHLHHYFSPSLEIFRGIGQGYEEDPEFAAFYEKLHPDMPRFFRKAIDYYCDVQEGKVVD